MSRTVLSMLLLAVFLAAAASADAQCADRWTQCGGKKWGGPTCCAGENDCIGKNEWYSQCVPKALPVGIAGAFTQCGGSGWEGPTTCEAMHTCVVVNQYYSQCTPTTIRRMVQEKVPPVYSPPPALMSPPLVLTPPPSPRTPPSPILPTGSRSPLTPETGAASNLTMSGVFAMLLGALAVMMAF